MANQLTVEDRLDLADLMTGWIHRDAGRWDALRELFHPGATIEISWFRGTASDFVDGSQRMAASAISSKHLIAAPLITAAGDRAVCETNAIIMGRNEDLDITVTTHNRFIDRVEKRDGAWRIVERGAAYDFSFFENTAGAAEIDLAGAARHPVEYRAMAQLLELSGFEVQGTFATRGSELERSIVDAAQSWLTAG